MNIGRSSVRLRKRGLNVTGICQVLSIDIQDTEYSLRPL